MYPRGFVLIEKPDSVPANWVQSRLFPDLYFDPTWHQVSASSLWASVEIIGTCVPIDREIGAAYNAADDLLARLTTSESDFLERLSHLSGRHVIFWRRRDGSFKSGDTKVVTDATGMRTVFYNLKTRTVASHARLAAADEPEAPIRHQWGYPGICTPWPSVKLLTPNTYLTVRSSAIQRFYPTQRPKRREVDEAAKLIDRGAKFALRNYRIKYGDLHLGLTAGLDSRTTLAMAIGAGVGIEAFTHVHGSRLKAKASAIDASIAAALAKIAGCQHSTEPVIKLSPDQLTRYAVATYYPHVNSVTESKRLSGGWPAFLSSNLFEIGRCFYRKFAIATTLAPPATPGDAARLYSAMAMKRIPRAASSFEHQSLVQAAYREFFESTRFSEACESLDPFDALYWEHRMAAWHGILLLARDFGCDTFIPINARSLFDTMLGVDAEHRKECAVFKAIIAMNAPKLLEIPINPKDWPPVQENAARAAEPMTGALVDAP